MSRLTPAERRLDALDRAKLLLSANLVEPADRLIQDVLHDAPDDTEARLIEARLRLRRLEPRLALPITPADPTEPTLGRQDHGQLRAAAYAAGGQIDAALLLLLELSANRRHDLNLLRPLAGLQLFLNQTEELSFTLSQILELDPTDRGAARLRSDLLAEQSPAEALDTLGPIADHNRGRAARLCRRLGRFADAEAHYADWLRTQAQTQDVEPSVLIEAAAVAQQIGEAERALHRLTMVAESGSASAQDRAEALRSIGRLRLQQDELPKAGRAFFAATRLMPGDAEAWAGLTFVAERADRPRLREHADTQLKNLRAREDRRRLLAELLPHTTAAMGNTPAAATRSPLQRMLRDSADVMAEVSERFPGRADVHYHRAMIDTARGEFQDADIWVAKALEINPRYVAAKELAESLAGNGADWE